MNYTTKVIIATHLSMANKLILKEPFILDDRLDMT